jgi:hypothetical protein
MNMTNENPWFFEMRAEAFVTLVLTKHNDVKVMPDVGLGGDVALHLRIEILEKGKPTSPSRFFAAQLVPHLDLPDDKQRFELGVSSHSLAIKRDPVEGSFPICVFVVGVRKPEGYFRWCVEPRVVDGRASLVPVPLKKADWQLLDEAAADRMISQLNAYYDAPNGNPEPRGRHSRMASS